MMHPFKTIRPMTANEALPDRSAVIRPQDKHLVFGTPMEGTFEGLETAVVGMGCFWGAERLFWRLDGVLSTAVGYAGGFTANPTYEDVCSGQTGHAEVVRVVFDPAKLSYDAVLKRFWEEHDPTQGLRQGNDVGSQYRSVIYTSTEAQLTAARTSKTLFEKALMSLGQGAITTEIEAAPTFYFAEPYHQQYLARNPNGYCGLKGTGAVCPIASPGK